MIRSLGVALLVFVAALLLGGGVILASTQDPYDALSRSVTDQASVAASTTPADDGLGASLETPAGEDGLGAPLDAPVSAAPAAAATQETLNVDLQQVRSDLLTWHGIAMLGGFVAAALWLAGAFARAKSAVGYDSQRAAGPAWFGYVLLFGLVTAAAAFWAIRMQGLWDTASGQLLFGVLAMILSIGLIAYHLATALGAPLPMLPSVPLGRLVRRRG